MVLSTFDRPLVEQLRKDVVVDSVDTVVAVVEVDYSVAAAVVVVVVAVVASSFVD